MKLFDGLTRARMRTTLPGSALKRSLLLLALAAFTLAPTPAKADPGGEGTVRLTSLYYRTPSLAASGDLIRVTILPKGGDYTSWMWVRQDGTDWQYLGRSDEAGRVTVLNVLRNRELRFAIRVMETNESFQIGPSARNRDGLVHADVSASGPNYVVGFEDILGSSDRDYNDVRFLVEGASIYYP